MQGRFAAVAFPQLWKASSTQYDGDGADRKGRVGEERQLRVAVGPGTVEKLVSVCGGSRLFPGRFKSGRLQSRGVLPPQLN